MPQPDPGAESAGIQRWPSQALRPDGSEESEGPLDATITIDELPLPSSLRRGVGCALGMFRLALVGGAVRDLLCHRLHRDPWLGVLDLDLVVQAVRPGSGDAEHPAARRFAALLLEEAERTGLKVGFCHLHEAYGTVELEIDDVLFDLATARGESYPAPGENPVVVYGSLEDDLARRDFSINAMALEFTSPGLGLRLLDPHRGREDLARRQLRLLHARSLEDDPTRIVRAARYVARLDFSLAPESLQQLQSTLARWPWGDVACSGVDVARVLPALGTRLRMELELLLEREPWDRGLACLQDWGALVLVDRALQDDPHWRRRLRWARRCGLPLLLALLAGSEAAETVARRLQLSHGHQRRLAQLSRLRRAWSRFEASTVEAASEEPPSTPLEWVAFLERPDWSADAVALALVSGLLPRRPLLRWWCRWRHLSSPVPADDLIAAGLPPGPALGERLRQLRRERLLLERG